jgi:hypothetical protein
MMATLALPMTADNALVNIDDSSQGEGIASTNPSAKSPNRAVAKAPAKRSAKMRTSKSTTARYVVINISMSVDD